MRIATWIMAGIVCAVGGVAAYRFLPQANTPTDDELRASLARNHSSHPILDARITGCEQGTLNDEPVQVCGVCVVSVKLHFGEQSYNAGARLAVWRGEGTVAFRRAISAEQSSIAPSAGQRGVWLASKYTEEIEQASFALLSARDAQRAGFESRRGLGAWNQFFGSGAFSAGVWGGDPPAPIKQTLDNDPALAAAMVRAVGGCGD